MSNTVNHCRTYDSNFHFCNSQVFIYITKRIWTLIYLPIALRVARAKLCLLSEKSSECDIGGSLRYCEGWGAGTLWDIYIYIVLFWDIALERSLTTWGGTDCWRREKFWMRQWVMRGNSGVALQEQQTHNDLVSVKFWFHHCVNII